MAGSRTLTAIAGILGSLAVSLLAWYYLDTLLLFLLVPFIPILFRRGRDGDRPVRECPSCGFRTRTPTHEYCPRDGTRLE